MQKRKTLTRNQRAELFLAHKGVCHLCGLRIQAERGEAWEVEHVHALEFSGRNDLENLRPAHVSCHKTKTAGDRRMIAKSNRIRARHLGIKKPGRKLPGSKGSGWRKPLSRNGGQAYRVEE